MEQQNLPQVPDAPWFSENLKAIAKALKEATEAQAAFLSLPTMGEQLDHPAYEMSREYSRIIQNVADEYEITYLPLHETMSAYLAEYPAGEKHDFAEMRSLMMKAILRHYVLKQNWNKIGNTNGFELHTDHLHLNSRGAEMIADIVADYVLATER